MKKKEERHVVNFGESSFIGLSEDSSVDGGSFWGVLCAISTLESFGEAFRLLSF